MNQALTNLMNQIEGLLMEAQILLTEPTTYNMVKAGRLCCEASELLVAGVEEGGGDVVAMLNQQKEEDAAEAGKALAETWLAERWAAWTIERGEN